MDHYTEQERYALSRLVGRMRVNGRTYETYPGYIPSLLRIKKACALANAETGTLDPAPAEAIALACDALEAERGGFPVDTLVDAHPLLNEMLNAAIAGRAMRRCPGICPDRHVNLSQGGRDVVVTADGLFLHDALKRVLDALPPLEKALDGKGDAFRGVVKMGRDSLRDTLPVDLGRIFSGYGDLIRRVRARLEGELPRWNGCALGASFAGTGSGCAPGFRESAAKHLSAICGRPLVPCADAFAAVLDAESVVTAHAHLEAVALAVGRIAKALILMTSGPKCGFGDVRIPAAQPGSSIMPGKVNPVVPDMIAQIGLKVCADHAGIAHAAYDGDLEGGCDASMIRERFHESAEMLARGIPLFISKAIEGTQAGPGLSAERLRASWRPGYLLIRRAFGDEAARRVLRLSAERGLPYAEAAREAGLLSGEGLAALSDPPRMAEAESLPLFPRHAGRTEPPSRSD